MKRRRVVVSAIRCVRMFGVLGYSIFYDRFGDDVVVVTRGVITLANGEATSSRRGANKFTDTHTISLRRRYELSHDRDSHGECLILPSSLVRRRPQAERGIQRDAQTNVE